MWYGVDYKSTHYITLACLVFVCVLHCTLWYIDRNTELESLNNEIAQLKLKLAAKPIPCKSHQKMLLLCVHVQHQWHTGYGYDSTTQMNVYMYTVHKHNIYMYTYTHILWIEFLLCMRVLYSVRIVGFRVQIFSFLLMDVVY